MRVQGTEYRVAKVLSVVLFFILTTPYTLHPTPLFAAAPSLKLTPLKYQEIIPADKAKLGFIDVANPSDGPVHVVSAIQAFRQVNLEGDLEFYADDKIANGIQVATTDFELGPREAARIGFTVDPLKLGVGGVYAAVFFRTVPPEESAPLSHIATSAKVGTLLILNIGGEIKPEGSIKTVKVPRWNFGQGLSGTIEYANTATLREAIAFNPSLDFKVGPWGKPSKVDGPLVMPGNTRRFEFSKPGSYLGLFPLTLSDSVTHQTRTVWVFAATGFWRLVLILLLALLAIRFIVAKYLPRRSRPRRS